MILEFKRPYTYSAPARQRGNAVVLPWIAPAPPAELPDEPERRPGQGLIIAFGFSLTFWAALGGLLYWAL